MITSRSLSVLALTTAVLLSVPAGRAQQAPEAPVRIYNTVKQKLQEGRQVVGGTVSIADPEIYCAMANAGFDFTWIEMQHSPLTYQDVARMIATCPSAPAIPFIRVADATEGDIQKATDVGALGVIVPMVDTVEKAEAAVRFTKYPPEGRRSQGGGQYGALWGPDYRRTANDNIMIIAMIENPAGVDIADRIAAVRGIDGLFVASTDLTSFSGLRQGDPAYEALVTRIVDVTRAAGLPVLGGPLAWKDTRSGYTAVSGPRRNPAATLRRPDGARRAARHHHASRRGPPRRQRAAVTSSIVHSFALSSPSSSFMNSPMSRKWRYTDAKRT